MIDYNHPEANVVREEIIHYNYMLFYTFNEPILPINKQFLQVKTEKINNSLRVAPVGLS